MVKSISDIKNEMISTDINDLPSFVENYKADERKGVANVVNQAIKKYDLYLKEIERLKEISKYEEHYRSLGYKLIAGVDEVGRGPLAGPVVTAAVILKEGCAIEGINDSKKLSHQKREELYDIILKEAVAYSFGVVSPGEIDEINILQATYKAMAQAINGLKIKPDFVLADAVTIPGIDIQQCGIIKGDAKSISIGAASIIAKVYRDRMMEEYAKLYPEYGFEDNKGYGSSKHTDAIKKYGICPIHRRSFVKNFL